MRVCPFLLMHHRSWKSAPAIRTFMTLLTSATFIIFCLRWVFDFTTPGYFSSTAWKSSALVSGRFSLSTFMTAPHGPGTICGFGSGISNGLPSAAAASASCKRCRRALRLKLGRRASATAEGGASSSCAEGDAEAHNRRTGRHPLPDDAAGARAERAKAGATRRRHTRSSISLTHDARTHRATGSSTELSVYILE